MRRLAVALALANALTQAPSLGAQTLDPGSTEALATTLGVLLDPGLRAAAIAGNPQAAAADQQLRSLAGSDALTQELFALAADVFRELTQASGGDATKMAETLERARTDPATFASMLSAPTLERLRALSIKISDQRR